MSAGSRHLSPPLRSTHCLTHLRRAEPGDNCCAVAHESGGANITIFAGSAMYARPRLLYCVSICLLKHFILITFDVYRLQWHLYVFLGIIYTLILVREESRLLITFPI